MVGHNARSDSTNDLIHRIFRHSTDSHRRPNTGVGWRGGGTLRKGCASSVEAEGRCRGSFAVQSATKSLNAALWRSPDRTGCSALGITKRTRIGCKSECGGRCRAISIAVMPARSAARTMPKMWHSSYPDGLKRRHTHKFRPVPALLVWRAQRSSLTVWHRCRCHTGVGVEIGGTALPVPDTQAGTLAQESRRARHRHPAAPVQSRCLPHKRRTPRGCVA